MDKTRLYLSFLFTSAKAPYTVCIPLLGDDGSSEVLRIIHDWMQTDNVNYEPLADGFTMIHDIRENQPVNRCANSLGIDHYVTGAVCITRYPYPTPETYDFRWLFRPNRQISSLYDIGIYEGSQAVIRDVSKQMEEIIDAETESI